MESNRFVIVDVSKGLYFAKNQEDRLTKKSKKVSWWIDEKEAQKTLNRIAKQPEIKQKAGNLTIMKLQDAKKKIAQNANHHKSGSKSSNKSGSKSNSNSTKNVEKSIVNSMVKINSQEVNKNKIEQTNLFNCLKSICSIVAKFQQEELPYTQKSLCASAAEFDEIKNSISKKIREYDNKDLDFLHVIELGKFDAVKWAKLIAFERENRQKRRQYKDEWLAINTLFPNTEPDMGKIKSRAKKCLETIELVESNNRNYAFRDKESKERFGNLLK